MKATTELPPLIQIAFDEELWNCASPEALRETLSNDGLGEELSRQARWSVNEFSYVDSRDKALSPSSFIVSPSASLNPFSKVGKCIGESCRTEATSQFMRTAGVYSDVAVLPDPITRHFVNESISDAWDYLSLFNDLRTLRQLAPLINSQVIRFSSPQHSYCAECYQRMEGVLGEVTESLVASIQSYRAKLARWSFGSVLLIQIPVLQPDHSHPLDTIVRVTEEQAALLGAMGKGNKPRSKRGKALVLS